MPQMGVSVAEGTVVEWRKARRRPRRPRRGHLLDLDGQDRHRRRVARRGRAGRDPRARSATTVDVGTVLAVIDGGGAAPQQTVTEATAALRGARPAARVAPGPRRGRGGRIRARERRRRYSPVVQRIAAEHGIDLSTVEGTGRGGRVRKQDVLAVVDGGGAGRGADAHRVARTRPTRRRAPPKARRSRWVRDEPLPRRAAPAAGRLSRMRQTIGEHMLHSLRTAATCTTVIEVDMIARRGRARAPRHHRPAAVARDDDRARCASSRRSTRRSTARTTPATTPSTSASRSRSARRA